MDLGKAFKRYGSVVESFVHKTRSKKNTDLISKPSFVLEDGVYILHETLGVKGVEGWNPKNNDGVIGILLIEDEHQLVVALEDAPENLTWSEERKLVNQPIKNTTDAKSDFNGEEYCRNLNSPDFPAAYYCKTYNKGNRSWYLPSSGELWLIYRHLEEVQTALSIVGGKKFVTEWDEFAPCYWSSTEYSAVYAWGLYLIDGSLGNGYSKVSNINKVRPVSNFRKKNTLRESFTKKISSKKNTDLISKPSFVLEDGVYILHQTLGVKDVEGWNPKNNKGVVGILFIEDDHKIVVALEDSPKNLHWSKKRELINQPVYELEDAESDFNGEYYCQKLDSPDFPAAYYCKTYNKGNRSWYLPSSGELWMIYNHLEEIQNALEIVGGQKLVTNWVEKVEGIPVYWSSTEYSAADARFLYIFDGYLSRGSDKVSGNGNVRPVSNFNLSELKESFTKKIGKKNITEVIGKSERMFLEESIAQMVYSFGKYDAVPDIDKKYILGYRLPFGCLPEFFEGNSNKVLDNGDVVKRTETRSLMGYTQTYEIIASHIYFNSSRRKVYVGMYRPSPLNQSESSPKIYNLYGAASSGILELSEFSIDELRQILQNLQERTKMKKPLRKKIVLKSEENY